MGVPLCVRVGKDFDTTLRPRFGFVNQKLPGTIWHPVDPAGEPARRPQKLLQRTAGHLNITRE